MGSRAKPLIEVLLVEDIAADARLVELLIDEIAPGQFHFTWVTSLQKALAAVVEQEFHAALLDLTLPDSRGLETLARLRARAPQVPIVVLTGNDDEHLAIKALQQGAGDYLIKSRDNAELIRRAIRYAIERARADASLRSSEGQFRAIFENASLGIGLIDRQGRLFSANPALRGMLTEDPCQNRDGTLYAYIHPDDRAHFVPQAESLLNGERENLSAEIRFTPKAGSFAWGHANVSLIRSIDGQPQFAVGMVEDVTVRKTMEKRLNHQASHDALTGLPNRVLLEERLARALIRAERNRLVFALLFLDLDQFKQINDTLGHVTGDTLLRDVATRLTGTVRRQDTVARLGGDEFVLIIEDISDFRDAATVAQKVLGRFNEPFLLSGQQTRVSTSIGIGLYPSDGEDAETLLRQADEAMYCAKKQGRDSFRFAATDLSEKVFERDALRKALYRTVDEGGLEIHYQPIIALESGAIQAVEALLRWRHPEIGLMTPGQFLPLAVDSGLMPVIGKWVLESALRQLALWRSDGHPSLRLCLNVGKSELHAGNFALQLHDCLATNNVPAHAIDIELPVALAMDATSATRHALGQLHEMTCRIAIDDFGAGRTDFHTLRQVQIDILKISPDYIRGLPTDNDEAKLINAAIVAAHSMSISVVAKAVETSEQYVYLRRHHCDAAQGYLFSRPLPPGEFPPAIDHAPMNG
ncbi:putative bifunctional diguanylate cyclase/phosphodiesterase [Telmatospirillum siberiense]|uniref:Two-component system response regulator n=1 Tax=Telmatospirillum siberiense TaxID=382514 RepID=A0A2N3PR61_9PROT|nr:EAL domain-containing protein [Telmatospirillum siberiense]PKU22874.1 hypothetical protein CWS72_19680 [Telmatospirillum siberiense]